MKIELKFSAKTLGYYISSATQISPPINSKSTLKLLKGGGSGEGGETFRMFIKDALEVFRHMNTTSARIKKILFTRVSIEKAKA